MVRKMVVPDMEWVDEKAPDTQQVAVMETVGKIDIKYDELSSQVQRLS